MVVQSVIRSAIVGVVGTALSADERDLFRDFPPLGFILFRRNCVSPDQMRMLVHELCEITGRADTPILIDQEGGRVTRLKSPTWVEFPAPETYGIAFEQNNDEGVRLATAAGKLMGDQMRTVGCTVNCAPMVDVPSDDAHAGVIGNRVFGHNPHTVATLARAYAEGLRAAGVLPVIKHIPGHGRATADSHTDLPVVNASHEQLAQSDFSTFKTLADLPLGMTAHVLYPALDPVNTATLSPTIIKNIIRGEIGFNGLLMTDDLAMDALKGSFAERTEQALAAGNDVVLYCREHTHITREVLRAATPLTLNTLERWERAKEWLKQPASLPVPHLGYNQLMAAAAPFVKGHQNTGESLVARV